MTRPTRKLTTILAADVVGFSKLMDQHEELTLKNLKTCRDIVDPIITEYGGRIFHTAGDSVIAEFASPVSSVEAAIEFQQILADRNKNVPEESQITFRVGIHLDDVIIEGDNIYGNGVNVAARLESICEPGCILVSRFVQEKIEKRIQLTISSLGKSELKNIEVNGLACSNVCCRRIGKDGYNFIGALIFISTKAASKSANHHQHSKEGCFSHCAHDNACLSAI